MDYDIQLLVYSSNLDLHTSQDSGLVSNLEPVTSYAVEVFISNGMMEDNQVIVINTTMGEWMWTGGGKCVVIEVALR